MAGKEFDWEPYVRAEMETDSEVVRAVGDFLGSQSDSEKIERESYVRVSLDMLDSFIFNLTYRMALTEEELGLARKDDKLKVKILDEGSHVPRLNSKFETIEKDIQDREEEAGVISISSPEMEALTHAIEVVHAIDSRSQKPESTHRDRLKDRRYLNDLKKKFHNQDLTPKVPGVLEGSKDDDDEYDGMTYD